MYDMKGLFHYMMGNCYLENQYCIWDQGVIKALGNSCLAIQTGIECQLWVCLSYPQLRVCLSYPQKCGSYILCIYTLCSRAKKNYNIFVSWVISIHDVFTKKKSESEAHQKYKDIFLSKHPLIKYHYFSEVNCGELSLA